MPDGTVMEVVQIVDKGGNFLELEERSGKSYQSRQDSRCLLVYFLFPVQSIEEGMQGSGQVVLKADLQQTIFPCWVGSLSHPAAWGSFQGAL